MNLFSNDLVVWLLYDVLLRGVWLSFPSIKPALSHVLEPSTPDNRVMNTNFHTTHKIYSHDDKHNDAEGSNYSDFQRLLMMACLA